MSDTASDVEDALEGVETPTPRILDCENHSRYTWRRGCRCNICREDHRMDLRERRAAKKQRKADEKAREKRQADHYPTMVAVAAQLDALKAMETNPGVAAIALRMAAILDDNSATPQQPAAAGKLLEALRELGLRPKQQSTQLASVREMVNRPKPVEAAAS